MVRLTPVSEHVNALPLWIPKVIANPNSNHKYPGHNTFIPHELAEVGERRRAADEAEAAWRRQRALLEK